MAKSRRNHEQKKTTAIITDQDGNPIVEQGKIYEVGDDGLYEIWTLENTVVRKKVMGIL
ncbi:MAG: hypothetical protein KJ658_05195 [Proteobacteria bacterium]|nr:hypothetical protein [Pseudomonadota bacterium]